MRKIHRAGSGNRPPFSTAETATASCPTRWELGFTKSGQLTKLSWRIRFKCNQRPGNAGPRSRSRCHHGSQGQEGAAERAVDAERQTLAADVSRSRQVCRTIRRPAFVPALAHGDRRAPASSQAPGLRSAPRRLVVAGPLAGERARPETRSFSPDRCRALAVPPRHNAPAQPCPRASRRAHAG